MRISSSLYDTKFRAVKFQSDAQSPRNQLFLPSQICFIPLPSVLMSCISWWLSVLYPERVTFTIQLHHSYRKVCSHMIVLEHQENDSVSHFNLFLQASLYHLEFILFFSWNILICCKYFLSWLIFRGFLIVYFSCFNVIFLLDVIINLSFVYLV